MAAWDIEAAMQEVLAKTDEQIDEETAYKWGSRAIACYRMMSNMTPLNTPAVFNWYVRGRMFEHEALEHAACVNDGGATLVIVQREISTAKAGGV